MISEKKSISAAERFVDGVQFWKLPETLIRRKIRKTIRANYKSAKSIFIGFFDKIRESMSTDFMEDDMMVVSKILNAPDKEVLVNAVRSLGEYGFILSITQCGGGRCKIIMHPDEIITSYLTDCYLQGSDNVDHSNTLSKMTMRYRHIQ